MRRYWPKRREMQFTRDDSMRFYFGTDVRADDGPSHERNYNQSPEEYIMSRIRDDMDITGLTEDLQYKINRKRAENKDMSVNTNLAVVRDRSQKFIVLERFSGERYECDSMRTAQGYVANNVAENKEFIVLEVKAIAGPKKPEVHWDSLEEEFEPVGD